jgi:hypothetical protein
MIVPTRAKSATIPPSGISVHELPTDSETKLGANTPVTSTASHIEAIETVVQAHFIPGDRHLRLPLSPAPALRAARRDPSVEKCASAPGSSPDRVPVRRAGRLLFAVEPFMRPIELVD